ncbi:hypothetical protein [Geminisphaera colitermitum]|uniref:hypothetical protein n=1 Tax=Geminisphaera colitermitum TaxID=1148786 RepID=UPI000158CB8C|nr:hypothetical protein [Geminisphaera colitermitum]
MKPAHIFAALAGFAGVVAVAGWTTRRPRTQSANMSTATVKKNVRRVIKHHSVTKKTKRGTFGELAQKYSVNLPETNLSSREGFGN